MPGIYNILRSRPEMMSAAAADAIENTQVHGNVAREQSKRPAEEIDGESASSSSHRRVTMRATADAADELMIMPIAGSSASSSSRFEVKRCQ